MPEAAANPGTRQFVWTTQAIAEGRADWALCLCVWFLALQALRQVRLASRQFLPHRVDERADSALMYSLAPYCGFSTKSWKCSA